MCNLVFTKASNDRTFFSSQAKVSVNGNRIILVTLGSEDSVSSTYLERFVLAVKQEAEKAPVKLVVDPSVDASIVDGIIKKLGIGKMLVVPTEKAKPHKMVKLW
jgi:hypothetical protein